MDLVMLQTVDLNVQRSQELDFRLITTSKSNLSEIPISRPTPQDSLSVPWFLFPFLVTNCQ